MLKFTSLILAVALSAFRYSREQNRVTVICLRRLALSELSNMEVDNSEMTYLRYRSVRTDCARSLLPWEQNTSGQPVTGLYTRRQSLEVNRMIDLRRSGDELGFEEDAWNQASLEKDKSGGGCRLESGVQPRRSRDIVESNTQLHYLQVVRLSIDQNLLRLKEVDGTLVKIGCLVGDLLSRGGREIDLCSNGFGRFARWTSEEDPATQRE